MRFETLPITQGCAVWDRVNILAKEAFPPEEYLPPEQLVEMARAENFDFWALLDGTQFVGFAVVQTYQELAYLFFLAIDPACRSRGYGGRAIETVKALYPGKRQVVDLEMVDETAPNNPQRIRRRAFYLRNGYRETGLFLSYLGVDYEVLCMEETFDRRMFQEMMATIQVEGFRPRYFEK